MAELHAALRPGDLAETLRRVTDAAVELLPDVDGATITVEHEDGRFETAAATGTAVPELTADTAVRLDRLQQALEEGPAVDVTESSGSVGASPGPSGAMGAGSLEVAGGAGGPGPGQAPTATTSGLSRDDRSPAYGRVAVSAGVRAQ